MMNCHEVQSKIAQLADGSPPTEIVAHGRECPTCRQILKETLERQEWLKERFAEVSAHLLAHAPPFSEAAFRETLERPALRAPLLQLALASAILAAAVIGWWTWANSPMGSSKSSFAERRRTPRESAERPTANGVTPRASSDPIASLSELKSLGPMPGSSWLPESGPMRAWPEQSAVAQPSPESAASQSLADSDVSKSSAEPAAVEPSPEVAASEPSPPARARLGTGVFKMQPTALAPDAKGYLAAIIPNDAADQAAAMVALSLTGLPAESAFYIRTRDVGGNQIWLGSGRTDTKGSAVAVMLRGSPTAAGRPVAVPVASREPSVTLNFDGATGEDLVVVDAAGSVLMTVGPATTAPAENQVNPSPTP